MADPNFNNGRLRSTLHDIDIGKTVRVKEICADPSVCQRLREMGFCEYIEVCKIAHGGALICRVGSGRMVLSQRLAKNIFVEAIDVSTAGKEK